MHACMHYSVVIIDESQPVKNRNLSRLKANFSRQNRPDVYLTAHWPARKASEYTLDPHFVLALLHALSPSGLLS